MVHGVYMCAMYLATVMSLGCNDLCNELRDTSSPPSQVCSLQLITSKNRDGFKS